VCSARCEVFAPAGNRSSVLIRRDLKSLHRLNQRRQGCEADASSLSAAEVKTDGAALSDPPPPYAMACLVVRRENSYMT
jgi:hypothetical protein